MSFRGERKRSDVTISLTPLIDVLFLFIIFFMLTGTFKRAGELELQLPDSATAAPSTADPEDHQLELVATEAGRFLLDGEELPKAQLKQRLIEALAEDPLSRVLIKAEAGVDHGEVVLLLDIVRSAGYKGVGIGTYTKPAPPP
jgi:biopolymer transport protein ExbD